MIGEEYLNQQWHRKMLPGSLSESFYVLKNKRGLTVLIGRNNTRIIKLLVPDAAGNLVNVVSNRPVIGASAHPMGDFLGANQTFFADSIICFLDVDQSRITIYPENKTYEIEWGTEKYNDQELSFKCRMKVVFLNSFLLFTIELRYFLAEDNSISIKYEIVTDKKLILIASQSPFFNLNGADDESVLRHQLYIKADKFVGTNNYFKHLNEVTGTPFDFRKSAIIGSRIFDNDEQLKRAGGYNHFFLLNKTEKKTAVAKIKGEKTGIIMEIYTDQPVLKFQTLSCLANWENDPAKPPYRKYASFALKTGPIPGVGNIVPADFVVLPAGFANKKYFKYRFLTC